MQEIKILQNFAHTSGAYQVDRLVKVDKKLADIWVNAGLAIEIKAEKEEVKVESNLTKTEPKKRGRRKKDEE